MANSKREKENQYIKINTVEKKHSVEKQRNIPEMFVFGNIFLEIYRLRYYRNCCNLTISSILQKPNKTPTECMHTLAYVVMMVHARN